MDADWKTEFLKRYKPAHPLEYILDENECYEVTDMRPKELNANRVFFEVKRVSDGQLINIVAWTDTLSTMIDCEIFRVMRDKSGKIRVIPPSSQKRDGTSLEEGVKDERLSRDGTDKES